MISDLKILKNQRNLEIEKCEEFIQSSVMRIVDDDKDGGDPLRVQLFQKHNNTPKMNILHGIFNVSGSDNNQQS